MYLIFTFTGGGGGLIGERGRERASATCGRWWYFEGRGGGDGVVYLGISEGAFLFFFVFFS